MLFCDTYPIRSGQYRTAGLADAVSISVYTVRWNDQMLYVQ